MTPAGFAAAYGPTADTVARSSGLSRWALLSQWAVESGWGTSYLSVVGHNQAGIRYYGKAGTSDLGGFAGYGSLAGFAADAEATWALSYYAAARAYAAAHPDDVPGQLAAIAASPWDAGHYSRTASNPAGSLATAWAALSPAEAGLMVIVTVEPFGDPAPGRGVTVPAGTTLNGYDPAHPGAPIHSVAVSTDSLAHVDATVQVAWPGDPTPPVPSGGPFYRVTDGPLAGLLVVGRFVALHPAPPVGVDLVAWAEGAKAAAAAAAAVTPPPAGTPE